MPTGHPRIPVDPNAPFKAKRAVEKANFIACYESKMGNASAACRELGIDRSTYDYWCKADPEFKKQCQEVREMTIDFAESALHKGISDGVPSLIMFKLKCQGKSRGYVEKQTIEVNTNLKVVGELPYLEGLTDEDLIALQEMNDRRIARLAERSGESPGGDQQGLIEA